MPGLIDLRVNIRAGTATLLTDGAPVALEELGDRLAARSFGYGGIISARWHEVWQEQRWTFEVFLRESRLVLRSESSRAVEVLPGPPELVRAKRVAWRPIDTPELIIDLEAPFDTRSALRVDVQKNGTSRRFELGPILR